MVQVQGGRTERGDWVAIVCEECKDGITYWDHRTTGWPTLADLTVAAQDHYAAEH